MLRPEVLEGLVEGGTWDDGEAGCCCESEFFVAYFVDEEAEAEIWVAASGLGVGFSVSVWSRVWNACADWRVGSTSVLLVRDPRGIFGEWVVFGYRNGIGLRMKE